MKFLLTVFIGSMATLMSFAINPKDTRMLSQPSVSATHIAFIYAEDLWIANEDGNQPRRLTVDQGVESDPMISPDGTLVAFSAEYDGNVDVFVIPVEGGMPKRLTWHPGADVVRGFSPDSKKVLFSSRRDVFTRRYAHLFTVSVDGGFPSPLEIPTAFSASYSPDGKHIAYNPIDEPFRQWKHYRGGSISVIWIFSSDDKSSYSIPQPEGGCNDSGPSWMGDKIYFRSDRNGEFNVYSYDIKSKEVKQLTRFTDFPVINMSAAHDKIVFEQSGYLHLLPATGGSSNKIAVGIAADLLERRARFVKGGSYIRSAGISPSGNRTVFDFRGDIITLPAEKGDARNITQTVGVHEKYPSWSADGKSIAYFSDVSGEYELHIKAQDGKGTPRVIKPMGTGFYAFIRWSPDSKKLCYVDNGRNLYVTDVATGATKKIDADELYLPGEFRYQFGDWSSDSKWITYTKILSTNYSEVFLYSMDQQKSFPATDGLSDAKEPAFSPNGKYLVFLASTDAGPVVNWFDQSSADMRTTSSIYLMTLQKETSSPFAKQSDEEQSKAAKSDVTSKEDKATHKKAAETPEKRPETLRIDFESMLNRIVDFPIKPGNYGNLGMIVDNEIIYVSYNDSNVGTLHKYDIEKRKDSDVMELDVYWTASNRQKILYRKDNNWGIFEYKDAANTKVALNTGDIEVKIDPVAEWPEIFDEAWRVNRDYFYDPNMHGVDWPAMKKKYAQFLPDLACRGDLYTLIQWMCSELAVGHHFIGPPSEKLNSPQVVKGGLLGADFNLANNRYQIKKIYGGLNWTPELRSPLTEPGVNAKAGEYIIAVNGRDLTSDKNIDEYFEATAGKIVELSIGPNPNATGTRLVNVVPVDDENSLRNRDWVEGNLRRVTEATNGQVAYVYVPNTAGLGHDYFKRYFFPQANRKAIIVDERFNGGGLIADYYIEILQRPYQAYWNLRYGRDLKTPSASIQGPKVMIIDETAGSGGDMFPWMFRKFKVGTIVGKRTWGGLVGILGFPEFIDGGVVTAPNLAIWTKDGFIVENVGIPPDIEVEQTPSEVIKGKDPQLEKAIAVALEELKKNPPEEPKRPAYPVKVPK
ncbi:MAG: PDZ domain-containing protein [Chryseolinea sp.]